MIDHCLQLLDRHSRTLPSANDEDRFMMVDDPVPPQATAKIPDQNFPPRLRSRFFDTINGFNKRISVLDTIYGRQIGLRRKLVTSGCQALHFGPYRALTSCFSGNPTGSGWPYSLGLLGHLSRHDRRFVKPPLPRLSSFHWQKFSRTLTTTKVPSWLLGVARNSY